MNRIIILAGFLLYPLAGFASSLPPVNLGNFSNQSFTPRGGVVPDISPSVLSSGATLIEGVIAERDPFQTLVTDDETLLTVSGHVKKMSAPLLNAAGNLSRVLVNASGVEVRFWQPQAPGQTRSTLTDENGNYQINLTNGFWRGEACGSGVGYSPNAWEVTLQDNKLIAMQEVSYSAPSITANGIDLAMLENNGSSDTAISTFLKKSGEPLSINGTGFGCNGSLVFVFHNWVNQCLEVGPVEYDHQLIVENMKNNIDRSRTDIKIQLPMPDLSDDNENFSSKKVIRRIAKMYYQKGNQRSNSIFVGEYLDDAFAAGPAYNLACLDGVDEVTNSGAYTDQTNELEDLGQPGSGPTGGFTGGADPAAGPTGGFAGSPTTTGMGSTVITGLEIAIEGNLNLNVDTQNLQFNLGR